MADGNRALSKQIEKLSVPLETLETRIGGAAKTPGPKPTEGERFCALPPVPPRPLGADVPNSIMHYAFPAGVIIEPEEYRGGLTPHLGLSEHDIAEVRRFYPKTSNTGMPKLEPFRSQLLTLKAAEQKDFVIEPTETRRHTIRTFGSSDTVMVLFESRDNDTRYIAGDDDSGSNLNAEINEWLTAGRRYVLRVRLYLNWASGDSSIMLW